MLLNGSQVWQELNEEGFISLPEDEFFQPE